MKGQPNVWAGTALALLMTAGPLQAGAMMRPTPHQWGVAPGVILAQEEQPTEEELRLRRQQEEEQRQQQAPAEEAPPPPEATPEAAPQPEEAPAPPPEAEQPPAPEPAPEAQPEAPAPEQEAPPEAAPAEPQEEETPAEPQAEEPPAPEQPAPEAPAEQAPAEQAPAEQPAPEQPAEQPAPTPEQPPAEGQAEEAPAEQQQPAPEATPEQPAPATPEAAQPPAEQPAPEAPAEQPAAPETAPAEQPAQPPAQSGEAPLPENAAPVLDSQKQQPAEGGEQPPAPAQTGEQAVQPPQPAEPAGPPPQDDQAAQQDLNIQVQPVTQEQGTRLERAPETVIVERPRNAEVVREVGDRVIIEVNNQIIVESNERPRFTRGAREVYYEELSRGRTREVVVRDNGVQVVTVRNRYGDVVRRSRIMPDGTEYILAYVDDERYAERYDEGVWIDPGADLPPMSLTIPVEDYILDAERVEDPDIYYTFLDQPPVERVERLYSVDEVKRSARIRDKTRRVDLDTITFEFGSASIPESEIPRLEGVATAIERILERNPAETFLIEGHTDAVGTEIANLALSDRRAEAVAEALSSVFGIPPENLTTQGYGEQFLKIRTEERERENRRVAIRRITPLVAPVASAQ